MKAWFLANAFLLGIVLVGSAMLWLAGYLATVLDELGEFGVWPVIALQVGAIVVTYYAARAIYRALQKRVEK